VDVMSKDMTKSIAFGRFEPQKEGIAQNLGWHAGAGLVFSCPGSHMAALHT